MIDFSIYILNCTFYPLLLKIYLNNQNCWKQKSTDLTYFHRDLSEPLWRPLLLHFKVKTILLEAFWQVLKISYLTLPIFLKYFWFLTDRHILPTYTGKMTRGPFIHFVSPCRGEGGLEDDNFYLLSVMKIWLC